ncbi:hypothetical protein DPMN_058311 [Dreissena polymorpha]|uniref:Uncharacterized protein n=1 Tax=Dreissena polymorpha TaxID=45954 RepID=A0A9D4C1T3_DREPO|nr:hypothetical protein DPMN_058311 [Dreissena polymorpha]
MITPCIWKPGTYSFLARNSTFLSRPNINQVVSTPCRTVCLANNSSFCQIGHFITKWPTSLDFTNIRLSTGLLVCDQRQPQTSCVSESSYDPAALVIVALLSA